MKLRSAMAVIGAAYRAERMASWVLDQSGSGIHAESIASGNALYT